MSAEDLTAAEARHRIAVAEASPRLFGNALASTTTDPIRTERYQVERITGDTITGSRQTLTPEQQRYNRYGANVGVRFPLFGTRVAHDRKIAAAEESVAVARLKDQVEQMENIKALRYAYVERYYRAEQERLAQNFLNKAERVDQTLSQRAAARQLLESERRVMQTPFLTARHFAAAAKASRTQNVAKMRLLTGRNLDEVQLVEPSFTLDCAVPGLVADRIDTHPDIRLHNAILMEKKKQAQQFSPSLPDAGLSLSVGYLKDKEGSSGNNAAIVFDISMPLSVGELNRSQKVLAITEAKKAELALNLRRSEYMSALDKSIGELDAAQESERLTKHKLTTAEESHRVARLRSNKGARGETSDRLLSSEAEIYYAANQHIDAKLALARAQIDLLGIAQDCRAPVNKTASDSGIDEAQIIGIGSLQASSNTGIVSQKD